MATGHAAPRTEPAGRAPDSAGFCLADLALPHGLPAETVDGMDVLRVRDAARAMLARARAGGGASFLECLSYRFGPHSTASRESRPAEELRRWQERCPIRTLADRLRAGALDEGALGQLWREAEDAAEDAAEYADAAPPPAPAEGLVDVG